MPKASLLLVLVDLASSLRPRGVARASRHSPLKKRRHAVDALKSCTRLRLRHDIKLCAAVAATWVGARGAAENVLAACGRCSWHARDAKRVQRSLLLNGHYGVRCFASRAHRVRCMGEGWPLQTWSTLWKRDGAAGRGGPPREAACAAAAVHGARAASAWSTIIGTARGRPGLH